MDNELGTLIDLTWKLLLVLGLAVLATRALRWLSIPTRAPDRLLRVIARLPIGPQQSLVLIAVGRRRLLVGQSTQQLTLLAELGEEDLALLADAPPDASRPGTLTDRIRAYLESPRLQRVRPSSALAGPPGRPSAVPLGRDPTMEGSR